MSLPIETDSLVGPRELRLPPKETAVVGLVDRPAESLMGPSVTHNPRRHTAKRSDSSSWGEEDGEHQDVHPTRG